MAILTWVLVGLVGGVLAWLLTESFGLLEDVIVAVVGAIVGGWLFVALSGSELALPALPSLGTSLAGSLLFLVIARSLTQGRSTI